MDIAALLNAPPGRQLQPVAKAELHEPQPVMKAELPRPRRRTHAQKRMDMASLDLFTQRRQHRPELSMSRIMQELASNSETKCILPPASAIPTPTYASQAVGNSAAISTTEVVHEYEKPVKVQAKAKVKSRVKTTRKRSKTCQEEQTESEPVDDSQARRRRPRGGFTPLTESEKRVKQRMLVKRSYYRKIDTLVELRSEMKELEMEYKQVVISRRQMQEQSQVAAAESDDSEDLEDQRRYEELREQYTRLAVSKDALRHENERLRATAMDQSKAQTRVGILLDEELRDEEEARIKAAQLEPSPPPSPPLSEPSSTLLQPLKQETSAHTTTNESNPKQPLEFTPLTEDECLNIARDAYTHVQAFRDTQHYVSTGASVFGWRDRRQIDGDTLRFFLEKTFSNITTEEISSRVWDLVSSERGVNRIYASDVAITFRRVQRVNAENVLFYRTIEPQGQDLVFKSLVLASRIQTDDAGSFMLLFRSVDPASRGVQTAQTGSSSSNPESPFAHTKREVWSDVFSWGLYEAAGDQGQHCRNIFGGFVSSLATARSLEFWLMHVLLIAVRCESEVVGPLFILP